MTPFGRSCLMFAAALLAGACGDEDRMPGDSGFTSGSGSGPLTGGDSGGDSGGTRFDIAEGETDGQDPDGQDGECQAIDFLFVIDNSGSMLDEQQNLIASFPGFADEIKRATGTEDFHLMVVGSDDAPDGADPDWEMCVDAGCCADYCDSPVWAEHVCVEPGGTPARCDGGSPYCLGELGDGRVKGLGGQDCGLPPSPRFITQEQVDLGTAFSCIGNLGINGSGNEKPMEALVEALSAGKNAPLGCNEGFLRKNALLVIVVITDEEDDHETMMVCDVPPQNGSAGEPENWFKAVVGAAHGIEQNVVVLSLVGPTGANACPVIDKCNDGKTGAEPAPRIEAFTNMFSNGTVGPVCAADYRTFFAEAVGTVDEACEAFLPPG